MDPSSVWFEITESALVADLDLSTEVLDSLRHLGVRFAIDDFGTGYSSLNYLQRFPAEALKIDRSFVRGLREGSDDEAIISAVTHLGHSLNLLVTAEGVEHAAQLVRLRELGCDHVQGLFIGAPQPAARGGRCAARLAGGGPDRQDGRRLLTSDITLLTRCSPSVPGESPNVRSRHRRHRPQPHRPGHEGLAWWTCVPTTWPLRS